MNPRQRRGLLLIGLAVVGALAVFLSVSNFVADVQSQVGPVGTVVRLSAAVEAFQTITADQVEVVEVPDRWRPPNALVDPADLGERVAASDLPPNTVLQEGMLRDAPAVQPGERQLAILINAETGVGGVIGVGDVVDIIATRAGQQDELPTAEIVIQGAQILSLGAPQVTEEQDPTGLFTETQSIPVTFALPPDDVLRLAWIESFAVTVRLALRSPVDEEVLEPEQSRFVPVDPDAGVGQ